MKKKLLEIFVCMLLLTTMLPMTVTVIAGDEEDPEVEDRTLDVKLFGFIGFPLQTSFKYADIVSAWFSEESTDTDNLYVSIKVMDLQEKTNLEAIYDVNWVLNNKRYLTCVHANPNGYGPFLIGENTYGGDDYEWDTCSGNFDLDNNIITWEIPKDAIGNPQKGDKLTYIFPSTHLRFRDDSNLPRMDLFKDLAWNAKIIKDYTIEY